VTEKSALVLAGARKSRTVASDMIAVLVSREAAQDLAANVVNAKPSTIIEFAGSCRAYFNVESLKETE
jgi:hypothetical protein